MSDQEVEAVRLGQGVLSWPAGERRNDRYALVWLMSDPQASAILPLELHICGRYGRLLCYVVETRQSQHIGDLFHGFSPSTPDLGDWIILGEGVAFSENVGDWGAAVGLQPLDDRSTFWLDPRQLYKVHDQTVDLYFQPCERIQAGGAA